MKRNDMIRQMELYVQECKRDNLNQYETMESLLDLMEDFGMLPPDAMPPSLSLAEQATKDAIWVRTRFKWESKDES